MKILFDHLCFMQKYGGVPRYFVELLKRLPRESTISTVRFSNNEYLKELDIKGLHNFLPNLHFRGKTRFESEFGKIFSIPKLLKEDFDIYHQTHYDPFAFKYLSRKIKTVTTIHDMNFWTIPEFYSKNDRLMKAQMISAQKASHIITISHNTKNDIQKYWQVPENKISVIYHGIEFEKYASVPAYISAKPYILFVGNRNKYKNFEGLVKSFCLLVKSYPDLQLYCAGNKATISEINLLKKYNILNSVFFFQASDMQLISLYKGAKIFVFPSYYEGFGLPILEAMASNCPIALSNTSCFPEIANDAAVYFNPYDITNMTEVIKNVLSNESLQTTLKQKGKIRARDFSWSKCAQDHLKVYKSLLQ